MPNVGRLVKEAVVKELSERLSERRQRMLSAVVFTAVDQASDAVEITDRSARVLLKNRQRDARGPDYL